MADTQLANGKGETAFNKNGTRMLIGVSNVHHRALWESFHTSQLHCIFKGVSEVLWHVY